VIRLTPELQASSFFAPTDAGTPNITDGDLGLTGPVLLPRSRAFIIGKSGVGYLLSTRDLGGIGRALASVSMGAAFGGDAYAAGTLYVPETSGFVAGAGVWAHFATPAAAGGRVYAGASRPVPRGPSRASP
jgi:hypothetical protein